MKLATLFTTKKRKVFILTTRMRKFFEEKNINTKVIIWKQGGIPNERNGFDKAKRFTGDYCNIVWDTNN